MALMVDVDGDEGATNTGSQSEEDDIYVKSLRATLKKANLTKILDAFEKESMTAKDLIYYCTKEDIQDMIKQDIKQNSPEVKISTKDKIKFIRTVMTIQQKLNQQQTAQTESKQDIQAEDSADPYSDLKRMLGLNTDNKVEPKRIIEFMETQKDVPCKRIFEIIEDKDNGMNLKEIFDMFDYGLSNGIDLNRIFGASYPDLKRLFQYQKGKKVNSRDLQRIILFMHKVKDVDLQRLWDVIDDKRYKLDLKAASDLFDPDEIDLESMFGKNYGYLTRLF
eukprot:257355_1